MSETRERISKVDREIQEAKRSLLRLERAKKSLVWEHYYGSVNSILLRKRLKTRLENRNDT